MSVQAYSKFPQGGTMTWANDMQYLKESFSAIIILIITMILMTMMMIV